MRIHVSDFRIGSLSCVPSKWGHCHTVDHEIFMLKIIHVKNFRVVKFSRFRSIRDFVLTVDYCSMDEHLVRRVPGV